MVKRPLIGMALLLSCYSPAAAEAGPCGLIADASRIDEVGAFSNMRYTEEHAYGYRVMLWRVENCLVGLFESSEGLAGDTPIGELRDVRYDRRTGALSFSAKLTMGLVSFKGSRGFEPSRDVFAFDGHLGATRLTGTVSRTNQKDPNARPVRERVTLRASATDVDVMRGRPTYGEWRHEWQAVLQARGPKW